MVKRNSGYHMAVMEALAAMRLSGGNMPLGEGMQQGT